MSHDPDHIELPAPTCWPIVTAFGLTLLFAGLVTSLFVSLIGLIAGLIGAVGWFLDVHPSPKHESVAFEAEELAGSMPHPQRKVSHLKLGKDGHRMNLPLQVHPYLSGVRGGIAGGIVMAVLACAWGFFKYGSIWYPVNLLAAAGVPELALAGVSTLKEFSLIGLIVGIITHGSMSLLVGLLYVVLLPMLPSRRQWLWGGLVTPLIWSAIVSASLRVVNPALAQHVDWFWFILCQVAFGVVGGYVVFKSEKVETMQNLPLAVRLGVEAQEKE